LAKRWEAFGEASRACWALPEVSKALSEGRVGDAFENFIKCMRTKAAGHLLTYEEAKEYERRFGRKVAIHPIARLAAKIKHPEWSEAQIWEDAARREAWHPISAIAAELKLGKMKVVPA